MNGKLLSRVFFCVSVMLSVFMLIYVGSKRYSLHGDALGYYLYLPATFIYHNNNALDKLPEDKGIPNDIITYVKMIGEKKTPLGYANNQYTYGVALMEAPFFFATHWLQKAMGKPANGFSMAYNYSIKFAAFLYGLLGLVLVYKILTRLFAPYISLIATLLLLMGTNLFWFTMIQGGMSHTPLFFLYASLMYLTILVHQRATIGRFIAIGFILGLITIIRPTDILSVLIPLLYNVYNKSTLIDKLLFIKANLSRIAAAIFFFLIPILPQLLYWKYMTGKYLYYSYGEQSFSWLHPHIIEGLFYFSNGWLPYAMVMVFSVAGFVLYKAFRPWAWTLWIVFPIYVYVIYCWYCFNYINGLGSRPMLHIYPLLAIPLAAFVNYLSPKNSAVKIGFSIICLFFIAVNMSYSYQQANGLMISEQSNFKFNLKMLFKTKLTHNDMVVNDINLFQPDSSKLTRIGVFRCNNFDDSLNPKYIKDNIHGSKYLYEMGDEELLEVISDTFSEEKFKNANWIKCSGKFMYPHYPDFFKHLLIVDIDNRVWTGCKVENKILEWDQSTKPVPLEMYQTDTWGFVYYFVPIPKDLKNGQRIKLLLWNTGKRNLYMDDLCLELYK